MAELSKEEKYDKIVEILDGAELRRNRARRESLIAIQNVISGEVSDVIAVTTDKDAETEDESIDLSKLTVAELKAYAEEKEIDLGDATKKADILTVIKISEDDSDGGGETAEATDEDAETEDES